MSDDTTLPGIARTDSVDSTDFTDNSLITDLTQIVSCVVGKDRNERQRQKIREELVRDHIDDKHQVAPPLIPRLCNIFRRS